VNSEERLEAIETKVAYQERAVDEIGESLGALQLRLRALEMAVRHLSERLDAGSSLDADSPARDERPPHY